MQRRGIGEMARWNRRAESGGGQYNVFKQLGLGEFMGFSKA